MAVAGDGKAVADKSAHFDLQSFKRAVHVTNRAAAARLFAEDMPRFERGAKFNLQITLLQISNARKTKFKMRREPIEFERITGVPQIADNIAEICFAKMRQHPPVVNVRTPPHQTIGIR